MTDRSPSPSHTVRVPDDAAGGRLDRFLAELPEIGSRSAAERLLAEGAVRVDGVARAKSYRLEGGEEVEVTLPEPAAALVEPEDVPFRIAYEDEHLLVVDKPAGVVVHPGAGHSSGTLVHGLVGQAAGGDEDRPGIVHQTRPRHLGLAGRRPLGRGARAPAAADPRARRSRGATSRSFAAVLAPGAAESTLRSDATGTIRLATRSTRTLRGRR